MQQEMHFVAADRDRSSGSSDDFGDIGGGALGCLATFLLILGGVVVTSIGTVPPLHYGLKYNALNKMADTENVYTSGRYLVGPWNSFLIFPATTQNIEFTNEPRIGMAGARMASLHSRTREGLSLHLQISLQYKLLEEQIGKLYTEFNMGFQDMYISVIRDVIIKTAAEYHAPQLWNERRELGDEMQRRVDKALKRTYAECWGLQLLFIDLPDRFESAIVNTQVQKQNILTQENAQAAARIRAETSVIQAQFENNVTVTLAGGRADYQLITKTAEAQARQNRIDAEAKVVGQVKKDLGLGGTGLVKYQKYAALTVLPEANILYGLGSGATVLVSTPPQGGAAVGGAPSPAPGGGGAIPQTRRLEDAESQQRAPRAPTADEFSSNLQNGGPGASLFEAGSFPVSGGMGFLEPQGKLPPEL